MFPITDSKVVSGDSEEAPNLVLSCPYVEVSLGRCNVPQLEDTGSMVTTTTESFFKEHFEPWSQERVMLLTAVQSS